MLWWALYVVAIATLLLHFSSRNAVWGSATLGFLIGVVIALFGDGFDWWTVAKAVAIAATIGTLIEWIPRLLNPRQERPPSPPPDYPTEP